MLIASELFHIITSADAEEVWETLTLTDTQVDYLQGLTVESAWAVGSTVTLQTADGLSVAGTVLIADQPRRLSYGLGDMLDEPSVYVTWQIREDPAGTVVRLYVDELDGGAEAIEELESAWLPILFALKYRLDRCGHRGGSSTS